MPSHLWSKVTAVKLSGPQHLSERCDQDNHNDGQQHVHIPECRQRQKNLYMRSGQFHPNRIQHACIIEKSY